MTLVAPLALLLTLHGTSPAPPVSRAARSQTSAAAPAADPASLSSYLKNAHDQVFKNFLAAAETMPAGDYGFRPSGAVADVRTFAQLIGHSLEVNSLICAGIKGEKDPLEGVDGDAINDKARLVTLLKESTAYCSAWLATLDDAALMRRVTSTDAKGTTRAGTLASGIVFAIAHANEHYGNVVTYLRAKGLVPPAAPSQVLWRVTVPPTVK